MSYKQFTTILVAAMLSACAGCGGGGGGGPSDSTPSGTAPASPPVASAPPAAAPPALKKTFVVMIRGDSTNYGSHPGDTCDGAPNQTCDNPAALMQTDFDILFGKGVVQVVNRAEPGSTLEDDLNGTGPYTAGTLASELSTSNADIVLTNAELNDATYATPIGQYQANLEQWVAIVRAAGKTPVIEEPNPTCMTGYGSIGANGARTTDQPYIDAQHAASLAVNVTVLPVTDAFLAQTGWQALLQADCEHPADTGYEFKEGQYMKNLYPIVAAMLKN